MRKGNWGSCDTREPGDTEGLTWVKSWKHKAGGSWISGLAAGCTDS